jgi:hypothetical protein
VTRQLNYFWFRECAVSARRKNSTQGSVFEWTNYVVLVWSTTDFVRLTDWLNK